MQGNKKLMAQYPPIWCQEIQFVNSGCHSTSALLKLSEDIVVSAVCCRFNMHMQYPQQDEMYLY